MRLPEMESSQFLDIHHLDTQREDLVDFVDLVDPVDTVEPIEYVDRPRDVPAKRRIAWL
jgi:hypothetical protein